MPTALTIAVFAPLLAWWFLAARDKRPGQMRRAQRKARYSDPFFLGHCLGRANSPIDHRQWQAENGLWNKYDLENPNWATNPPPHTQQPEPIDVEFAVLPKRYLPGRKNGLLKIGYENTRSAKPPR